MPSYDEMRHSTFETGHYNPVTHYSSAMQGEEQKQQMVNLARKLALWHAIDRQNRLQILHGQPIFGSDLRASVEVKLVCQDIFDAKRFKYVNWKRYKQSEYFLDDKMSQSVFNPCCEYNPEPNVIITDWPQMSESEIDASNKANLFIKEITCQTLQAIR